MSSHTAHPWRLQWPSVVGHEVWHLSVLQHFVGYRVRCRKSHDEGPSPVLRRDRKFTEAMIFRTAGREHDHFASHCDDLVDFSPGSDANVRAVQARSFLLRL